MPFAAWLLAVAAISVIVGAREDALAMLAPQAATKLEARVCERDALVRRETVRLFSRNWPIVDGLSRPGTCSNVA